MPAYNSFPAYYMESLLKMAGWPRRQSFFRRKLLVNAQVASMTLGSLFRHGVILGYGAPELAMKLMVAGLIPRIWDSSAVEEVIATLDPQSKVAEGLPNTPWDTFAKEWYDPQSIDDLDRNFVWGDYWNEDSVHGYSSGFLMSLMWSLLRPADSREHLIRETATLGSGWERAKQAGLEIDGSPPTVTERVDDAVQTVLGWELSQGELPAIESAFLAHPKFAIRFEP